MEIREVNPDDVLAPAPSAAKEVHPDEALSATNPPGYEAPVAGAAKKRLTPLQINDLEQANKRLGNLQDTTNHIELHKDNYIGPAYEDDGGQVWYDDEKTGKKSLPAMGSKHVVMYDTEDGKLKAYNRTPDTDQSHLKSMVLAAGQFLTEGFASSSPVGGLATMSRAQKAVAAADAVKEATGTVKNAGAANVRVLGVPVGPQTKVVGGVEIPIPKAAVTDNVVAQTGAKISSAIPGAGGPLREATENLAKGVNEASDTASRIPLGGVTTSIPQEAGEAARLGIAQRIGKTTDGSKNMFDEKIGKLYDRVDAFATGDRAPLDNTLKAAQDIASRFSATAREGMPESIKDVLGAVTHPNGLTYQAIKDLRTSVGESIKAGAAGVSNGELKQLYGALTEDLKATLKAQGGQRAINAWEKANRQAAVVARQRETLTKIVGAESGPGVKADEAIFNAIWRKASSGASADAKALALAKNSMAKSEWSEVASATVAKLGRTTAGEFNPDKFVRDYGAMSPAGKALIVGTDTRLRKALDNIAHLAGDVFEGAKEVSHSPGEFAHVVGAVGILHHLGKALAAATGANMLGRLLSRPATAENVAKFMQSQKLLSLSPTKGNMVAFNNATRALATDAAEEANQNIGAGAAKVANTAGKGIGWVLENSLAKLGIGK